MDIHIGKVVQNAILFNARRPRGERTSMDDLLRTVQDLFDLLEQRKMKYVLVGGIALLQYVQGRNTEDIDLILSVAALKKLPEITITSQDVFFARGQFRDLQVDFLLTNNPLFARVQRAYTTTRAFFERTIPCATVEGLMLLKLYALPSLYRQGDFARVGLYENDLATLMFYHQPDLGALLQEMAGYVSDQDLRAIQEVIADLERRVMRFRHRPG